MINKEDIFITKHAQEKMHAEGISFAQIVEALERGSKFQQTEGFLVRYSYYSIAYKVVDEKYIVKTVFLNR
jgi:hypothetical protein